MDNIDSDLFGRNVKGAMYQPVDETLVKYKKAAYDIVRAAYDDNVVSPPSTSFLQGNAAGIIIVSMAHFPTRHG